MQTLCSQAIRKNEIDGFADEGAGQVASPTSSPAVFLP